jgi:hypothetical protein
MEILAAGRIRRGTAARREQSSTGEAGGRGRGRKERRRGIGGDSWRRRKELRMARGRNEKERREIFGGQARGGRRATSDVGPSCQPWKFPEGPGI